MSLLNRLKVLGGKLFDGGKRFFYEAKSVKTWRDTGIVLNRNQFLTTRRNDADLMKMVVLFPAWNVPIFGNFIVLGMVWYVQMTLEAVAAVLAVVNN